MLCWFLWLIDLSACFLRSVPSQPVLKFHKPGLLTAPRFPPVPQRWGPSGGSRRVPLGPGPQLQVLTPRLGLPRWAARLAARPGLAGILGWGSPSPEPAHPWVTSLGSPILSTGGREEEGWEWTAAGSWPCARTRCPWPTFPTARRRRRRPRQPGWCSVLCSYFQKLRGTPCV